MTGALTPSRRAGQPTRGHGPAPMVRRAGEEDVMALGLLVHEVAAGARSADAAPGDGMREAFGLGVEWLDLAAIRPGGGLWVAELGRRIAGFARVHPRELVLANHVGEVLVGVHPDVRGQGVGARLLEALVAEAAAERRLRKLTFRVADGDEALARLAARAGFVEERREPGAWQVDGRFVDAVRVMRRLDGEG